MDVAQLPAMLYIAAAPGSASCDLELQCVRNRNMLRVLVSLASLHGWSVARWDVSTAFLFASLPEGQDVYCRPPNVLVRLGLVQPGIVWKLKKALYGLRTSPKAWEEERDQKLGQLHWDTPQGRVGLVKVESANCVWMIQALEDKACSNPLGMVIAYVDDIIAVVEQDQLDRMKSELDKLYVMKTSGFIPSKYDPEVEPLRFLGCLTERLPTGQIIMHRVATLITVSRLMTWRS